MRKHARKRHGLCTGKSGKPLMSANITRARQLLKKRRTEIAGHRPFTIRPPDREDSETQTVEYGCDAGDHHIGKSGSLHRSGMTFCRTSRSELRHSAKNERAFRARRVEKRRKNGAAPVSRGMRRGCSPYRPGDAVWIGGKRHAVHEAHGGGTRIILENGKSIAVKKVDKTVHTGGWRQL